MPKRLQTRLFPLLSFGVWRRRFKTHEPVVLSWAIDRSAESREDFFGLFYSVICNSIKSQNVMLPAFYSIPALPLAWFNTVVLIYAVCLLSAAPSCEGIYLPGILKTDFTEPSTSVGYWEWEWLCLPTWLCRCPRRSLSGRRFGFRSEGSTIN